MNDTLTIDLKEVEGASPWTSDASILRELTRQVGKATVKIEARWEDLSPEERETYVHFAYARINFINRERNRARTLFDRARSAWHLSLIALKGEQEAFVEYGVAVRRFVDAILDAVERENLAFQETLTETLKEAEQSERKEPMTVEEARERRRQLRHQVLE